jgi:hypothetical protein
VDDPVRSLTRALIGLGVMGHRGIDAFCVAGGVAAQYVSRVILLGVQITRLACGLVRGGEARIGGLHAFIAPAAANVARASGWASVFAFSDIASSNIAEATPYRDEVFPADANFLLRQRRLQD